MRDGETPRICYTDPSGTLRGPFEEWRILEWYRQGFFANTILFNLEKRDAQFSLGELIERFGRDNPFANRADWEANRLLSNGAASSGDSNTKAVHNEQGGCSECRRNGEKLDALLAAVHRLQTAVDTNAQNVADNTTAIASLRAMLEESRLSAWKWNAADIGSEPQQKLSSLPSFADMLGKEDPPLLMTKETLSKNEETCSNDLIKKQNGGAEGKGVLLGAKWPIQDFQKEEHASDETEVANEKTSAKSIQLDNLVSAELMRMQLMSSASKNLNDQQESILDRIKKKANGSMFENNSHQTFIPAFEKSTNMNNQSNSSQDGAPQHENDWINANTRPSFHPFPGATTPSMAQQIMAPPPIVAPAWPGTNNYHQTRTGPPGAPTWGQNNPFSALHMTYQNSSSPPMQHPPTFAAAALKEKKEVQQQRKLETEETGPRLVPVGRNPPRMMRRAPTNK